MDIRLQGKAALHYGVNGGARQNSRLGEDDALKFLSREEKECLQFFENTIESLEEGLGQDDQRPAQVTPLGSSRGPVACVDRLPMMSPHRGVRASSQQDIIDLVHPEPDLVHTKDPTFYPTSPDCEHMLPAPQSHFEVKPNLSSEYDPSLPRGSYGSTDSQLSYHPPGSVPTPVLIAQKIAENQGDGTAHLHPSTLLRRLSLESEKSPSNRLNVNEKHSPSASTKTNRFPPNINLVLSSKEQQKPVANVNIHERQEQMLANLSGTSHPLVQDDSQQAKEQKTQNTPSRSISFKDPEPNKSRMEALSKLGLNRNRATSFHNISNNTSQDLPKVPETRAKPPEVSRPRTQSSFSSPGPNITVPPSSYLHNERKPEILQTHSLQNHGERSSQENLYSPTISENIHYTPPPAEVTALEFNNYGGKSVVVHPLVSPKSEPTRHDPKDLPPTLSNPPELNPYGGKTKVMAPSAVPGTRNNLPDILSSHIDKSQSTPTKLEPQQAELNSYGGKSRSINPAMGSNPPVSSSVKSVKPPPPAPAPKPSRHSYHGVLTSQKTPTGALSPDYRRKPSSMFRPQGITVQFCGRGAMNESRREALRKLGLLKDS